MMKKTSLLLRGLAFLKQRVTLMIGLMIVVLMAIIAIFAPWLAPYDPYELNLEDTLSPPSFRHPLGTDSLGRDILSRLFWGARISLTVGMGAVFVGMMLGTVSGIVAGYFGKVVDNLLSWVFDLFYSLPSLLLAIALSASFGQNIVNIVFCVGISIMPIFARVTRSAVLVIKKQVFIDAAKSFGGTEIDILVHHVLPNVAAPLIVVASMTSVSAILIEASLSFLGLGLPPPTPSWGYIVSRGKDYMLSAPWIIFSGGLAIFLTVLGFNLLGDGMRDYIDPYTREMV